MNARLNGLVVTGFGGRRWHTDTMERQLEYVLRTVEERNVRFVRLWFTDVAGMLKSFAITPAELEDALEGGMEFDGSCIEGFTRIQESDMLARPDPGTFELLHVPGDDAPVARMFCDIHTPAGEPFDGDPRYVLKRTLEKARERGFTFYVAPEMEWFYFKSAGGTEPLDHASYFDLTPSDFASKLRKETILALEGMGIPVQYSPPRDLPVAAGDRPPLHRRPDHGRQHPGLPRGGEGGGLQPRGLRHLHAQAGVRVERVGDAHPPVPVRR